MKNKCLLAALCLTVGAQAQAGYVEPDNVSSMKTHTFDNKNGSDSVRLQQLIDSLATRGGIIRISSDKEPYLLGGIQVTSNVHLRIEPGVRIEQDSSVRGANVFSLRGENISVCGLSAEQKPVIAATGSGHETPDITSFRAIGAVDVKNFHIANLFIEENDTRFSTIMTQNTAVDGTIEDITMTGSGPGWGLLQMQGGSNIIARNLDGQGGFTLRLEQGSPDAPGGIQNLKAENIIGRHARAAVLIAPKSDVNGYAEIKNITSYGCQWAVLSSSGKGEGVFKGVTFKGSITAHYDEHGSQYRTLEKQIKNSLFLPPELQEKVTSMPGYGRDKFSTGPASGAIKMAPVEWVQIDPVASIRRIGFPFEDPAIVSPAYVEEIVEKKGQR